MECFANARVRRPIFALLITYDTVLTCMRSALMFALGATLVDFTAFILLVLGARNHAPLRLLVGFIVSVSVASLLWILALIYPFASSGDVFGDIGRARWDLLYILPAVGLYGVSASVHCRLMYRSCGHLLQVKYGRSSRRIEL